MAKKDNFGMLSVKAGIDNNPDPTHADRIAGAKGMKKGGRAKNTRRMNRLEELGRVDAEKAYTRKGKRNLKAEKKRIVRSLNSRGAAMRGHGKEIK